MSSVNLVKIWTVCELCELLGITFLLWSSFTSWLKKKIWHCYVESKGIKMGMS